MGHWLSREPGGSDTDCQMEQMRWDSGCEENQMGMGKWLSGNKMGWGTGCQGTRGGTGYQRSQCLPWKPDGMGQWLSGEHDGGVLVVKGTGWVGHWLSREPGGWDSDHQGNRMLWHSVKGTTWDQTVVVKGTRWGVQ